MTALTRAIAPAALGALTVLILTAIYGATYWNVAIVAVLITAYYLGQLTATAHHYTTEAAKPRKQDMLQAALEALHVTDQIDDYVDAVEDGDTALADQIAAHLKDIHKVHVNYSTKDEEQA